MGNHWPDAQGEERQADERPDSGAFTANLCRIHVLLLIDVPPQFLTLCKITVRTRGRQDNGDCWRMIEEAAAMSLPQI